MGELRKHPAEAVTFAAAVVAFLVQLGVLDQPTGAWLILGLGTVPRIVTGIVELYRARPR
jgi:hypothetical protein